MWRVRPVESYRRVLAKLPSCLLSHHRLITDLDISCFTYRRFGKELLKRQGLSPDSVLQVALQLAYYR